MWELWLGSGPFGGTLRWPVTCEFRNLRRPAQWLDRVVATIGRADPQPIQVPCGFVDNRHDEYSMVE